MPANTRDIKRRIRAISNTKKITKAMELVAAAKMRRTTQHVLATRAYSHLAWQIIQELGKKTEEHVHPLLEKRDRFSRVCLILIASNRGLSGSFNKDIVLASASYIDEQQKKYPGLTADIVLFGKKGKVIKKHGHTIVAEYDKPDVSSEIRDVLPVARLVLDDFLSKKYDKIAVSYMDFRSTLRQVPTVVELLPLGDPDTELGRLAGTEEQEIKGASEYTYEPSPEAVLNEVLARLVEVQIFQALLESNASEHSARMMAMRNASDAAVDMIDDLTFAYNQARQESITTELADISGGRAALE